MNERPQPILERSAVYRTSLVIFLTALTLCLAQTEPRVDAQGDLLPTGAIARLGTQRYRHDAPITCQAVSSDGKLVATGGGRTIRVWNATNGKPQQLLSIQQAGRPVSPSALAFSPDRQMLVALGAYGQGAITVWDLHGGQARQELLLPQREDYANTLMELPFVAFAGTNKQILVKNYSDKAIRQFDLESGMELRTYQDGSGQFTAQAISEDGHWLAAGTETRQIVIWDTRTGKEAKRLTHDYPLVNLAFAPNGQQLAAMDQDLAPTVWNLATGKVVHTLPARTRSTCLIWSFDSQSLYVSRQPDEVVEWKLNPLKELNVKLPRQWVTGPIYPCLLRNEQPGLFLGSAGRRGNNVARLRRIDPQQPEESTRFDGYETGGIFMAYLSQRKLWATIGTTGDSTLRLWNQQGQQIQAYQLDCGDLNLRCYAVDARGTRLALCALDGRVLVIDTTTGKVQRTLTPFPRACYDVELTDDGEQLVVTDLRHVKVINLNTGVESNSYELHTADPLRSVFSADGSRLATMIYQNDDDQIHFRIVDTQTGKALTSDHKMVVQNQNFYLSNDGRSLVIMGQQNRGGSLTVLEAATGKTRYQVSLPADFPNLGTHARLSPDGRWLVASASGMEAEQSIVAGYRLGSKGDPILLQGHRGTVLGTQFSLEAGVLATVATDSTILLWDLARHALQPATSLPSTELEKLWQEIGRQDASLAFQGIHRLAQQPQAAAWLGRQISDKALTAKTEQIDQWIKDLNAVPFKVREQASKQLLLHASQSKTAIRTALQNTELSIETRRRLEQIAESLKETSGLTDNPLQTSRALETLEIMGTNNALKELETLSQRTDTVGQEAKDSARRLRYRLASSASTPP